MTAAPGSRRPRPSRTALLLAAAVLAAIGALGAVGLRGADPAPSQAELAQRIASGLRCPVCEDLSAADSPAPLARQMRAQIAAGLADGESPAEIRQGFIDAYGNSVLMTPPREGLGRLVHAFPVLALGLALGAGGLMLRRTLRPLPAEPVPTPRIPLSPVERDRVEQALDRMRTGER